MGNIADTGDEGLQRCINSSEPGLISEEDIVKIGGIERNYLDALYVRFNKVSIDDKIKILSKRMDDAEVLTCSDEDLDRECELETMELCYIAGGY